MDENLKETLKQLVNTDGKLIVTDDMPDDIKDAINYFNDNNIDIFNTDFDADTDIIKDFGEEANVEPGESDEAYLIEEEDAGEIDFDTEETEIGETENSSEDIETLGDFL